MSNLLLKVSVPHNLQIEIDGGTFGKMSKLNF